MFNFDFSSLWDFSNMDLSGLAAPQINYDALANLAVQTAVASPAVVNTPANTAPSAPAVEKVVTAVIKAVAPDNSDAKLTQIAKQATQAVVTNPAVVASPAGQIVTPAVVNTIATTVVKNATNDSAASVTKPVVDEQTKAAAMRAQTPAAGTGTPVAPTSGMTDSANATRLAAAATGATGATGAQGAATGTTGATGTTSGTTGATGTTGTTGATGGATGATGAVDTKPDPTKTAYADLTPAQRAAMSSTEKTDYIQAAREATMAADATARAASDPMKNFAVRPEAPAAAGGMLNYYSWIGGVNTGEWKLYQAPDTPENQAKYGARSAGGTTAATASSAVGANTITGITPPPGVKTIVLTVDNADGSKTVTYSDGTSAIIPKAGATGLTGATGDTGGATGGTGATGDTGPTTNITYLKASLRKLGFSSSILDSSTSFLTSLLKEGLDYDNATEIFLNNKDYTLKSGTKIESPFYAEYGYLNEGLVAPKSANELFNAVEGYKEVVDKYGLSKKYLDKESLKQYTKNNVSAKDLAERANIATLKSNNQDPSYIEALQKLGYIATSADLKDFFMDSKIGQEQLNINRTTGAFAAEAVRRAQSGIQFNSERFKALAQTLVEKGMGEAEASALAAQGFENIAAQLGTTTKLSGIYENQRVATMGQVQSELEKEQFSGLESERRKRLKELETRAFQGSSGITSSSLAKRNILGTI